MDTYPKRERGRGCEANTSSKERAQGSLSKPCHGAGLANTICDLDSEWGSEGHAVRVLACLFLIGWGLCLAGCSSLGKKPSFAQEQSPNRPYAGASAIPPASTAMQNAA